MKKLSLLLFILPLILISCDEFINAEKGNAHLVYDTIAVTDFSEVVNNTSGDVYFKQNSASGYKVSVVIDENLAKYIKIEKKGESISIKSTASINPTQFQIHISAPNLNKIENNGSGAFRIVENLLQEELEITNNGSGNLIINNGNISKKIDIQINGSGDAYITNFSSLESIHANLNGSGDFKISSDDILKAEIRSNGSGDSNISAKINEAIFRLYGSGNLTSQMEIKKALVEVYGSGDADVSVSESLKAKITGSGNIYLTGTPLIELEDVGSGEIRRRN